MALGTASVRIRRGLALGSPRIDATTWRRSVQTRQDVFQPAPAGQGRSGRDLVECGFAEQNRVIGWYDHDFMECGGRNHPQPIRQLLEGYSYWETWVDAAVEAAEELGIIEATCVWMIFDHKWSGPAGRFDIATGANRIPDTTPYYSGAFPYTRR